MSEPGMVEAAARAAFFSDDINGHHKPGPRVHAPYTWENIPEEGRANYRRMVTDALAAALTAMSPADVPAPVRDQIEAEVREKVAREIEALRARHFAQHGNEENGPRNYDWALTHAANLARTSDALGARGEGGWG